jgi:hypothetical protein
VVEGVRQLFVTLLNETEDGQVALMRTPGSIPSNGQEFLEYVLAESLQRHLAKLAKGLPVRFRHVVGQAILAV